MKTAFVKRLAWTGGVRVGRMGRYQGIEETISPQHDRISKGDTYWCANKSLTTSSLEGRSSDLKPLLISIVPMVLPCLISNYQHDTE